MSSPVSGGVSKPSDQTMSSLLYALPRLFETVWKLIRSWWCVDRVRISPREGELLRLDVPCILRIGAKVVQVSKRRVGQKRGSPYVVYEGCDEHGPCELWVSPVGATTCPRVRWVSLDAMSELDIPAEEIEVFG